MQTKNSWNKKIGLSNGENVTAQSVEKVRRELCV